jgi:hypothetical protein
VSCAQVLFAVRAGRAEAERRVAAVRSLYGPLGLEGGPVEWHAGPGVLTGAVGRGDGRIWGEPAEDGCSALVQADGSRVRLIGGSGAPRTWYAATGSDGSGAWATHAVAAALLAGLRPEVDPAALPELMALGAPLGEATLLRGVRCLPAAAIVDLEGQAPPVERSYFPRAERWARLDEREADEAARAALLETLGRRLGGGPPAHLALTAGRDSPVVAAAAVKLGLDLRTFTWGEPDWPDVQGGARVASAFGLPHERVALMLSPDDAAHRMVLDEVLWHDGVTGAGAGGPPQLPADLRAFVTGAGAEVGRAYYYSWAARAHPRPRPKDLIATLGPLDRVPPEHRPQIAARLEEWLQGAADVGHAGWTALDVFYTEERMGRWGRARVPRIDAPLVTPFPSPEVSRALVSLPLDDRLTLAWHRRFVAEVAPDVVLPGQKAGRRGVPAVLRRAASRSRRRRAPAPGRWPFADLWTQRPQLKAWLVDEVLRHPVLDEGLGPEWTTRLREGLAADDGALTEPALLAAAPAALALRLEAAAG